MLSVDSTPPSRGAVSPSRAHIPALDGVRALAIAGVLMTHMFPSNYGGIFGVTLVKLREAGVFGVDLFFVISGFLITGILVDTKSKPAYFKNFYARRMLRLFPVYYGYLAIMMTVVPFFHRAAHINSFSDYAGSWWWYLLYFCNWKPGSGMADLDLGHFWSLAVEEQFYLVFPLLVLLFSRRSLAWICVILIVSATIMRGMWAHEQDSMPRIYYMTITRWDTIAFGALGALAIRSEIWRARCMAWAPHVALGGLLGVLAVAVSRHTLSWFDPVVQTWGSTFVTIGCAGFVFYTATTPKGRLIDWLRSRPMLALGKYSYGIYVYHMLIFSHFYLLGGFFSHKLAWPEPLVDFVVVVLSAAVTLAVAALSWRYFEAPILRLKSRFEASRPELVRPAQAMAVAES